MQALTDWREYRIGEVPQDWVLIGDGTPNSNPAFVGFLLCGSPYPNRRAFLMPGMGGVSHDESGYAWTAIDSAPDRRYHEIMVRFRAGGGGFSLFVGAEIDNTAYALRFLTGTSVTIGSVDSGGVFSGITTTAFSIADGVEYYARFGVFTSAGSSYLRAKVWAIDASEPGYTVSSAVTAPSSTGRPGIGGQPDGQFGQLTFCSITSGDGAQAPDESQLPPSLATILSDPNYNLAFSYEIEMADEDGSNVAREYFATQLVECGPSDFPADTTMPGVVVLDGSIKVSLSEEQLFSGLAQQQVDNIKLRNDLIDGVGALDYVAARSVQGRRVTYRVGDANSTAHRAFTVLMGGQLDGEPVLTPDQVEFQVASPMRRLEQHINAQRYIGINTAFYGHVTAPAQSYYALTAFTLCVRWRGVFSGGYQDVFVNNPNYVLSVDADGLGITGWSPGKISLHGAISDQTAKDVVSEDVWHWAAYGVDGLGYAYLVVDGVKVDEATGCPAVTTGTGPLAIGTPNTETDLLVMDFRLYGYIEPAVISTLMAQRSASDEDNVVGAWRGDDAAGTTVTDYSVNANHATGLDGAFAPSDEGIEQYAGQIKPMTLGHVWNGPSSAIDNLRPRFGAAALGFDEQFSTDVVVYSRGVEVAPSAALTTVIPFSTGQSEPITYRQTPTVDENPVQPTCLPEYITTVLRRCGVPNFIRNAVIIGDGGGLETMRWDVGNVITEEKTAADLLNEALSPVGGGLYYTPEGDPAPVYLLPPAGQPRGDYDEPVLELLPLSTLTNSTLGVTKLRVATGGRAAHDNSFCFWIKPFTTCDYARLGSGYSGRSPISPRLALKRLQPVDGAVLEVGGTLVAPDSSALRFGSWYFAAVTSAASTKQRKVYVGRLGSTPDMVATDSGFDYAGFSTGDFAALGGRDLLAAMSELSIWDKVLSAGEVAALMAAAPTVGASNLVNYYPLNDGPLSDIVTDRVTGATCRLAGARWTPRLKLDVGAQGEAKLLIRRLRPAWNASMRWRKNFRVLTPAEVSAAALASDAAIMKTLSIGADYPDTSIQSAFLGARTIDLGDSLIGTQAHAKEICYRARKRFAPGVEFVTLQDGFRDLMLLRPNDEFWLKYPRYGLDDGAAYRVVGTESDLATMRVNLTLLGDGTRFS